MKKIVLLLLLITSISYSQNELERNKIIQSSDPVKVSQLKEKYEVYFQNQKRLIDEYILKNNLTEEQKFSLQRIIDGIPCFYITDNAGSSTTLRANSMYPGGSLGLNVTGQGITAGVWDGGKVRNTHVEFAGRLNLNDGASTLSSHSTHVTGTIIAQGISVSRKGIAYGANARTSDWTNDIGEMVDFANAGFLVSNHSYGNNTATFPIEQFGMYNSQSIEVDDVMNAFPYYQYVKSAGNDRNNTTITQVNIENGYDLLTGVCNSKNVLTIAAVDQVTTYTSPASVNMSSFSNFGPPDDGRVKPDLCAKGTNVSSTNSTSDTAYTTLQGTSMASPAITGLIVLLQKHYNNLNPTNFMRSASVRGLLCQSARETGTNPGPDYEFGWGLADGQAAAQIISNKGTSAIFDERTLLNSGTYTTSFTINTAQNINVALSWTDPSGVANINSNNDERTPRLVNNLDLKVLKDGNTYYPWKLDPDNPTNAATNNSDNNVDNIERVEIFNATPGTYTIQVAHKGTLQADSQDYTLIASTTNGLTLNNSDFVADNNFFVYPNPAKNVLNYSNPNSTEVSSITITDITGKLVSFLDKKNITESIDISNLESGAYFIKFTTDTNSTVKKFIKN
jgi:serine protease AprX